MEFVETEIKGLMIITPKPHHDPRGFFMRIYDTVEFSEAGLNFQWVQENHSRSEKKGVIRGLHCQTGPLAETKLIRCIRGSVFDVAVDLRGDSSTFGRWFGLTLSDENRKMLLIPKGFAHGFCTLTEVSEVIYKVDSVYSPTHEVGIKWDDPDLDISWPLNGEPILSDRDSNNISLAEFTKKIM